MNEINKQVSTARRRLIAGKFYRILTWSLFVGLLLAAIGMLIPKIWHLPFLASVDQHDAWVYSWVLGGVVLSLLTAAVLTFRSRDSFLDVAVEVDRRFGLKERLSSAMTLDQSDADTEAGAALIQDAVGKAETIDVRDQFRFSPTWKALLPIIPAAIMTILLFVPNATEKVAVAKEAKQANKKLIEMAKKEFKKKIEEKRKQRTAKGLEDANPELKNIEKKFEDLLNEKDGDKKNMLIKLNDVKKQIEDRQKELGNKAELKAALNKLKDVSSGPAKELTDALSKGDLNMAKKAIKELADKLKKGKLSDVEKKQLAKDLNQMAKELQKMKDKHEADKKKLEDQIKKALEKGDLNKAAELQEKLDQKKQQDKQMQKMKKMAENLQKCANCMKPGGNGQPKQGQGGQQKPGENGDQQAQAMKEAGEALEDLAEQMEQMQQEMQEMEDLEDLEAMAGECKGNMQGNGQGDEPNQKDFADGEGRGHGKRDLEKENTGGFKARVKGKIQKGQTVVTGNADGENITGRSVSEVRELVRSEETKESESLENVRLPKSKREQAEAYFRSLRDKD